MKATPSREQERGQAIVILALAMIALLAFAALAIDGGNAYVNRRRAQNGADAGAMAGARQFAVNQIYGNPTDVNVRIAINKAAEGNGIGDSDGIAGNNINTNIHAIYTDINGNDLSTIEVGSNAIPPNAAGIRVLTARDFSTFIAGIFSRGALGTMGATAQATAVIYRKEGCGNYAIYASGPSQNHTSVHVTGSHGGGGGNFLIDNGGIYGGDGGLVQNGNITADPPPSVDLVNGGHGNLSIGGNAILNQNATQQAAPNLYDIADFAPSGKYANEMSVAGHYYQMASLSATGSMNPGLYYVDPGPVDLQNVTGNVSIVTTGNIKITGGASLTTYDQRFPLLFTTSSDSSNGAIASHNPDITMHGFIYAPNGAVKVSGARGTLYGAIYGKEVNWDASSASIYYEPAYCPPDRTHIVLLK